MAKHVYLVRDSARTGYLLGIRGEEASVRWSDGVIERLPARLLRERRCEAAGCSPSAVDAPEIADLEFATRVHPKTNTLIAERAGSYRGGPGPEIRGAEDIHALFERMSELDQEHIVVMLLDVRGRVTAWKLAHKGELTSVGASVKDILKDAILTNAAQLVVIHNHPSGDPGPSDADAELTEALANQCVEFGIHLFDHVIIGRNDTPFYSFHDDGQLPETNTE